MEKSLRELENQGKKGPRKSRKTININLNANFNRGVMGITVSEIVEYLIEIDKRPLIRYKKI